MAYGEKEYKDKCVLYVCVQYGTRHKIPYMRVHIGSCAEMLEVSAENFCFNDAGIMSSESTDFWSFIFHPIVILLISSRSFSFPLYLCALPLLRLRSVC